VYVFLLSIVSVALNPYIRIQCGRQLVANEPTKPKTFLPQMKIRQNALANNYV
jgi:hypothetical protein